MANGKFDTHNHTQMVETTLDLLHALDQGEPLSQRGLADRLGVALGLTNALLKRCVKKGLLKVRNAPAKRYAYYVTPDGMLEKGRLMAEYLSHSLAFYRRARGEYLEVFGYCKVQRWKNVGLIGASELAEIALIAANEADISIVGIVDFGSSASSYGGISILSELPKTDQVDALIQTDNIGGQDVWNLALESFGSDRVLSPRFLRVSSLPLSGGMDTTEQ